jgi:hypothetical protein
MNPQKRGKLRTWVRVGLDYGKRYIPQVIIAHPITMVV